MDVFDVHEQVIADYQAFTSGFVTVADRRVRELVDQQFADGVQWPDPWLSLNPAFQSGGSVESLTRSGVLHDECARIFRRKLDADDTGRDSLVLHQHQRDAIAAAQTGKSYVLTTGTGSGKSLAYIVPIVDAVLKSRATHGPGVKAIIVYPMNALANSQVEELKKFLEFGYPQGQSPVTFKRYTGQESGDERNQILANPPDILLTNYVMLDLVMTRPDERDHLIRAAKGLQFLVLDELHTYRGRQGADVAMLVRRLADQCDAPNLQVIGTSATMASGSTRVERDKAVAEVATKLFGSEVTPDRVIGETLVRATSDVEPFRDQLRAAMATRHGSRSHADFVGDALAAWCETTFGLTTEDGRLVRGKPITVQAAARALSESTDVDERDCLSAIRATLQEGSRTSDPTTTRPVFAFRLHQFLSKGDTVYVSVEPEETRHVTGTYQVCVPGEPDKPLLPLGFCRECGQEYLVVAKVDKGGQTVYVPRRDAEEDKPATGYLYVSSSRPWPADYMSRLPEAWLETDPVTGDTDVLDGKRKYLPTRVQLNTDGTEHPQGELTAWFLATPFAFCLHCGVSYEQVRGNDFAKLATLDAEGRSSAMTLISASIVKRLRETDLAAQAQKLLTFVDNRQDASLQAGHFNDFVQVAQLRGALHAALLKAGSEGLGHDVLAQRVTEALNLPTSAFAQSPDAKFSAKTEAERALRAVVEYQLFVDLERGWRVTMPNLEQTGLLTLDYRDLAELAADDSEWEKAFLLNTINGSDREKLGRILLDEFRRVRAISVDCLTESGFETTKKLARQHLIDPWVISEEENLVDVGQLVPRPGRKGGARTIQNVTGLGAFGKYLRRQTSPFGTQKIKVDDATAVIASFFKVFTDCGLLAMSDGPDGPEYQLRASTLIWRAGDGTQGTADLLRRAYTGQSAPRVNPFFRDLYRDMSRGFAGMVAREHTAQVPQNDRQERETAFRKGTLPLLYCSPTMELGVDISDLNAVGLRNVPPTPANYAQRSGRAGRSGQQALVLTYCATGNAHDSYWFRRSRDMVAGSVIAPRLDLANEELVRSHVHAIWLAETGQSLKGSITDIVEVGGSTPTLNIVPEVQVALINPGVARRAEQRADAVLRSLRLTWEADGRAPTWWAETWVYDQVKGAPAAFDAALDRWRSLYRTALAEADSQHTIATSPNGRAIDRRTAQGRHRDALSQLSLLRNDDKGIGNSDFYPYRYLASEGFLPGYSFPRLPLAAYIPARRGGKFDGDFLQRPRFLAINEFGPNALIYHEGARYEVVRVQLPRDGETVTESAKRCESCGYYHPENLNADVCEFCTTPLPLAQGGLMRLETVFTRRRQRISSDEEERRRTGFELEVSIRFPDRAGRATSTQAQAVLDGRAVLELVEAEAAQVRVANIGNRRRKDPHIRGFWLDLREGRWLSEKKAAELSAEPDGLTSADDVQNKMKVTPYVEDRRNVLVIRLPAAVTEEVAVTLRIALERGIEAEFQLEDSELDSRELPDVDDRGRMLLTEAAEGGAGVLGQLVADPGAMARVARRALELIHYDAETGEDTVGDGPDRCERGCYDCLLAYSNQFEHAKINRHDIVDILKDLMRSQVVAGAGGRTREGQRDWLNALRDSDLEKAFVDWMDEHGYHLPDAAQRTVSEARARPDLVYENKGNPVAIFVDGPHHDTALQQQRDSDAEERLINQGWTVLRVRYDQDAWPAFAQKNAWLLGTGTTRG